MTIQLVAPAGVSKSGSVIAGVGSASPLAGLGPMAHSWWTTAWRVGTDAAVHGAGVRAGAPASPAWNATGGGPSASTVERPEASMPVITRRNVYVLAVA